MATQMQMVSERDGCENTSKADEYQIKTNLKETTIEELTKEFPNSPKTYSNINNSNIECIY